MIDDNFVVVPNTLDENNPLEARVYFEKDDEDPKWNAIDLSLGYRWGDTTTVSFNDLQELKDFVARLVAFRDCVEREIV